MKKKLSLFLALALMVGMLAGCGSNGSTTEPTTDTQQPSDTTTTQQPEQTDDTDEALSGIVNTDGSTSMADVMAVLQESFKAVSYTHLDVYKRQPSAGAFPG